VPSQNHKAIVRAEAAGLLLLVLVILVAALLRWGGAAGWRPW
jgi:hypothetical protein